MVVFKASLSFCLTTPTWPYCAFLVWVEGDGKQLDFRLNFNQSLYAFSQETGGWFFSAVDTAAKMMAQTKIIRSTDHVYAATPSGATS